MQDKTTIRREIKYNAKRRFFGYLFPCIGVALLGGVITTLFSVLLTAQTPDAQTLLQAEDISAYLPQVWKIQGLSLAFSVLISPLTMGAYAFFMEVSADRKPPFVSVFAWLGEGRKAALSYKANLWYLLIALKYVLMYCVPGAAVVLLLSLFEDMALGLALTLYLLGMLALLAGAVIAFAFINAYLPAMYMLASNPDLGVRDTFKFCGSVMKPHLWEFFLFRLSFLGWEILAAVTFGLSVLFVTPYFNLSSAGWTRYIKEEAFRAMSAEAKPL